MNINIPSFRTVSAGITLSLYALAPVYAQDIEIYTSLGANAVTLKPNVMFILDTSGSMNEEVLVANKPYDPSTTYSGCFPSGRLYYSTNGSVPGCSSGRWFNASALQCDNATTPLADVGFHTDQYAQQRIGSGGSRYWSSIRTWNTSHRSYLIECADDAGVHGHNTTNTNTHTYITGGNPGWTTSPTTPSVWNSGANYVTIYDANYMNYTQDPTSVEESTRFEEAQKAIIQLVDSNNDINLGLMGFDGSSGNGGYEGGQVLFPVTDSSSSKAAFKSMVNSLSASSYTPLSETYYEALMYFGGLAPHFGDDASPVSVPGSYDGSGKYDTPIADTCQKNTIIFLTDGAPTRDNLETSELSVLPGFNASACASTSTPATADNCLDRLAGWAKDNDVLSSLDEDQTIITHTVGFDFSTGSASEQAAQALLERTAAAGGGEFKEAGNATELVDALNQYLVGILKVNSTFSSPAVSVNAFNRSTHLDDLYFTLFKPADGAHWDGNLKKYKIDFLVDTADSDSDGDITEELPFIIDSTGSIAVDDATGFFSDTSKSFWTDGGDDGKEVSLGGAAGELSNTRSVYTFAGSYTDNNGVNVPSDGDITSSANALEKSNANVTDAMLGTTAKSALFPPATYRETLLDWAYGLDVLDDDDDGDRVDVRQTLGDPLHAEPALVQYGQTGGGLPDLVAYVATNDGYLHAFNSLDGSEYWAFVPQELLGNLDAVFEDDPTAGKVYGIDGNVVAWVDDQDNDGSIEPGDRVVLYFGMRRGGNNIYAMDVSDRNKPELLWVIKGGSGDFADLAQTWSSINVEKLQIGGTERNVLIFGGGYDETQDTVNIRTPDSIGSAVYIVDAETGERLWWAGSGTSGADLKLTGMDYSVPGRVKPLDIDRDGFVDRLYFSDMGGQIWRVDIPANGLSLGNLQSKITGYKLAELAQNGSDPDTRRFYYPPDVALIVEQGKLPYLSVLAASGYRAHPLDEDIQDRIYMIRDEDVYGPPDTTPGPITESDLFDTTDNLIGQGTSAQKATAVSDLNAAKGWMIVLNELDGSFIGEKSLAEPLILDGVGIITTYIPQDIGGGSASACEPKEGTGSVFYVNITDGTPTYDLSGDDTKTREDRKVFLKRGGIPPSPNIIVTEDGTAQCVGTECAEANTINRVQKTIWYEQEI